MKLVYKGSNVAVNFNVAGVDIRVTPNTPVIITAKQAESLQGRKYIKALVAKGLLEFVDGKEVKAETKEVQAETNEPDSDPDSLNDLTKDELLKLALDEGQDLPGRTNKADIIKAIYENRK